MLRTQYGVIHFIFNMVFLAFLKFILLHQLHFHCLVLTQYILLHLFTSDLSKSECFKYFCFFFSFKCNQKNLCPLPRKSSPFTFVVRIDIIGFSSIIYFFYFFLLFFVIFILYIYLIQMIDFILFFTLLVNQSLSSSKIIQASQNIQHLSLMSAIFPSILFLLNLY